MSCVFTRFKQKCKRRLNRKRMIDVGSKKSKGRRVCIRYAEPRKEHMKYIDELPPNFSINDAIFSDSVST